MTARYSGQTTTTISGVEVPVPTVTVVVYDSSTAALATLTADGGGALTNPFTSDTQGNFAFNVASAGLYDVVYYVGGKQVLRQNGVPVGTGSNPLNAFVQNIINLTALTVTSANGQTVTTRGLLGAITPTSAGQSARLNEAGREGPFDVIAGNFSAKVTADTDKAVYVGPADNSTGSAKVWARPTTQREYEFSWWLGSGTSFTGVQLPLARALALIDPYSVLRLPGNTTMTVSAGTSIRQDGTSLIGRGVGTRLMVDPALSGASVPDIIQVQANNVRIRDMRLTGRPTGQFANNPSCLFFGGADGLADQVLTQFTGGEVSGCTIDGTSLGIVVAADNSSTGYLRFKEMMIRNNTIRADTQCISSFGAEDIMVVNNQLLMDNTTHSTSFATAIRILGTKNGHFLNNEIYGPGYDSTARFGIKIDTADMRGVTATRIPNESLNIHGNTIRNALVGIWALGECLKTCRISENLFDEDIASTRASTAFNVGGQDMVNGLLAKFDCLEIVNNTVRGFNSQLQSTGSINHLVFARNRMTANLGTAGYPSGIMASFSGAGGALAEIIDNRFLAPSGSNNTGGGRPIQRSFSAGTITIIRGNYFPEGVTALVDDSGGGTYDGVLADNHVYPSGSYAKLTTY